MEVNYEDAKQVLKAVQVDGTLVRFASEEIRENDKQIVMEAVKSNGLALQYVGKNFKGEKEVAAAAISSTWRALKHVSNALKKDQDLVLLAIQQNRLALDLADYCMTKNHIVMHKLIEIDPKNLKVMRSWLSLQRLFTIFVFLHILVFVN